MRDFDKISIEELKNDIRIASDIAWHTNLNQNHIDRWINNFKGEAIGDREMEQKLAYWLLYNFTYYNESEVEHLCRLMLRKLVHEVILKERPKTSDLDFDAVSDLISHSRFKALGRESESGAYIMYLFRKFNSLPITMFFNEESTRKSERTIFVDDVTISGTQALRKIEAFRYSYHNIHANEIKDSFISELKDPKELFTKRLKSILSCGQDKFTDKEYLADVLNDKVIKNKKFLSKYRDCITLKTSDGDLDKLLSNYDEKEDNSIKMHDHAIYKMNRLILENIYPDKIYKSMSNIRMEHVYLLTFIATEKAKEELSRHNITSISCMTFDDTAKTFSDKSTVFQKFPEIKSCCLQMCKYYGELLSPANELGFDDSQLLIGFYYTIPNNTLPIFWSSNNGWTPIFKRFDKVYQKEIEDVFGKYI